MLRTSQLKEEIFKVGDKVIPKSKSFGSSIEDSPIYKAYIEKELNYLKIIFIHERGSISQIFDIYVLAPEGENNEGDYFIKKDLVRYNENNCI